MAIVFRSRVDIMVPDEDRSHPLLPQRKWSRVGLHTCWAGAKAEAPATKRARQKDFIFRRYVYGTAVLYKIAYCCFNNVQQSTKSYQSRRWCCREREPRKKTALPTVRVAVCSKHKGIESRAKRRGRRAVWSLDSWTWPWRMRDLWIGKRLKVQLGM